MGKSGKSLPAEHSMALRGYPRTPNDPNVPWHRTVGAVDSGDVGVLGLTDRTLRHTQTLFPASTGSRLGDQTFQGSEMEFTVEVNEIE